MSKRTPKQERERLIAAYKKYHRRLDLTKDFIKRGKLEKKLDRINKQMQEQK